MTEGGLKRDDAVDHSPLGIGAVGIKGKIDIAIEEGLPLLDTEMIAIKDEGGQGPHLQGHRLLPEAFHRIAHQVPQDTEAQVTAAVTADQEALVPHHYHREALRGPNE